MWYDELAVSPAVRSSNRSPPAARAINAIDAIINSNFLDVDRELSLIAYKTELLEILEQEPTLFFIKSFLG